MVPVLNMIGTQCAVFGNHDFGRNKIIFTPRSSKVMLIIFRSWCGCVFRDAREVRIPLDNLKCHRQRERAAPGRRQGLPHRGVVRPQDWLPRAGGARVAGHGGVSRQGPHRLH